MAEWGYNSNTGEVKQWPDGLTAYVQLHSGAGWHGPFTSEQAALAWYDSHKAANPGWKKPSVLTGGVSEQSHGYATDPSGKTVPSSQNGADYAGWFLRIGEILVGLILLGVGVAKLSGTTNVIASAVKARI